MKHWSLTTLREKLIKIGANVVRRAKCVTFHMAEVPVPRDSFSIPPLPGFVASWLRASLPRCLVASLPRCLWLRPKAAPSLRASVLTSTSHDGRPLFRDRLFRVLQDQEALYHRRLEDHFCQHISAFV